jgi:hypothetical protein
MLRTHSPLLLRAFKGRTEFSRLALAPDELSHPFAWATEPRLEVEIAGDRRHAVVVEMPFIDPKKEIPKQRLATQH